MGTVRKALFIAVLFLGSSVQLSCAMSGASGATQPRPQWLVENGDFVRDYLASTVLVAATPEDPDPLTRVNGGVGTIIDADGLILTAAHVVGDAPRIVVWTRIFDLERVALIPGKKFLADVVATLPEKDMVLLRVRDPAGLPPPLPIARDLPALGATAWLFGKTSACVFGRVLGREAIIMPLGLATIEVAVKSLDGDSGAPLALPHSGVVGMLFASGKGDGTPSYFIPIGDAVERMKRSASPR